MWQTLVGAWPLSLERVKHVRGEGDTRGAHAHVVAPARRGLRGRALAWIDAIYADAQLLDEIDALAARLAPHGDRNSLAMLLVKLTAPGVPDLYQGTELRAARSSIPTIAGSIRGASARAPRAERSARSRCRDRGDSVLAKLRRSAGCSGYGASHFARVDGASPPRGPHAHRVFAFARGERPDHRRAAARRRAPMAGATPRWCSPRGPGAMSQSDSSDAGGDTALAISRDELSRAPSLAASGT